MDEFGVLVESIGFKALGKSAPMAKLKSKPNFSSSNNGFSQSIGINSTTPNDSSSFVVDDLDGIFRSNASISNRKSHNHFDDDDIFGGHFSSTNQSGGIDLDSVFKSSSNSSNYKNSFGSNGHDDLLGSTPRRRDSVDDLFGNLGTKSSGLKGKKEENGPQFDDLIPGFGATNPSNNGAYSDTKQSSDHSLNSDSKLVDDPSSVFESSVSHGYASWPFAGSVEQNAGKGSVQSSIDELEDFAMGKILNDANTDGTGKLRNVRSTNDRPYSEKIGNIKISIGKKKVDTNERELKGKQGTLHKRRANEVKKGFKNEDDIDMFLSSGVRSNHMASRSSTTEDSLFDTLFHEKRESEVKSTTTSSVSTKKASSMTNNVDDFSSLFGDNTPSGEFKEKEGESEERRRARLNHHIRTQARMAKALADKNQRDVQAQREQEERHMLAENMDNYIKRWAAGKEGNLRALLSSLQQVLWPECGWQQISLTDLITSTSVKKVYYKATLCVHPDKVQQKGANLQQKYIAEKVFDILKGYASWPFASSVEQNVGKGSVQSSIDELEDFAMGKILNDANTDGTGKLKNVRSTDDRPYSEKIGNIKISIGKKKVYTNERELKGKQGTLHKRRVNEVKKGFENEDDIDMFFSSGVQSNHMASRSSTTEDSLFDTLFHGKRESEVKSTTTSSVSTKQASSMTNNVDDFSSLFGDNTPSGEFKEKEGESEERRRARLNHHMRTQARMAKALADKNQRDVQAQREKEERHMLAETMDNYIKRWAAGKEGNLRALLSSLQQVLWPECGWQQISLTDLITSTSVKKVYYKATLCVHPDKVQQKGANLQQKYIAEKVFDILKAVVVA
ncbi:Hypothetical predicted protein [Olea europaea subsp. europaea]|uniref:Uncharacterized protein n=1 Tax=Olea europaea subsp. europaea TaxID=158383 RepID=A0A8S0TUT1_OLEEU|nr:Hypothetical predicted protein [Olea europaea subsp. europaea]